MSDRLKRWLFIAAGTICVVIGAIGVIVPVLPTTPFLLLAAICYTRSSERLYRAPLSNRIFGSYIRNYLEGRGIPVRVKAMAITFLWATILVSMYLVENTVMRVVLPIISIAVTAHILSLKTMQEKSK